MVRQLLTLLRTVLYDHGLDRPLIRTIHMLLSRGPRAIARRTRLVADFASPVTRKTLLFIATAFWPLFNRFHCFRFHFRTSFRINTANGIDKLVVGLQ